MCSLNEKSWTIEARASTSKHWFIFTQSASFLLYCAYNPGHSGYFVCFGEQIQTYISDTFYGNYTGVTLPEGPAKIISDTLNITHSQRNPKKLNQPQHGIRIKVPRNRCGSVKWRGVMSILLWEAGATPERSVLRHWLCNTWKTAAEKKWSVQWEKYGEWHYRISKIFLHLPHSESPAVLHKTAKINFLNSALAARIWKTSWVLLNKSSNVINRVMDKIRINPKKLNCILSV